MNFTRQNPSSRYRELLQLYREMHAQGEKFLGIPPEMTFPGKSLYAQSPRITKLIRRTGARTILDYGSGKGRQYDEQPLVAESGKRWSSILDYWDLDTVTCYDPAYGPFSGLPEGKFDGVICTDVMEHCPEEDIPWIAAEIFGYATRFVFLNAACFPAQKRLPSGENAHCTVRPPDWWEATFGEVAAGHPEVLWQLWVTYLPPGGGPTDLVERCIGNDR